MIFFVGSTGVPDASPPASPVPESPLVGVPPLLPPGPASVEPPLPLLPLEPALPLELVVPPLLPDGPELEPPLPAAPPLPLPDDEPLPLDAASPPPPLLAPTADAPPPSSFSVFPIACVAPQPTATGEHATRTTTRKTATLDIMSDVPFFEQAAGVLVQTKSSSMGK